MLCTSSDCLTVATCKTNRYKLHVQNACAKLHILSAKLFILIKTYQPKRGSSGKSGRRCISYTGGGGTSELCLEFSQLVDISCMHFFLCVKLRRCPESNSRYSIVVYLNSGSVHDHTQHN